MPGPTEFSATATGGSPVEQLREALNAIFTQLRGAGGRGADFTAMTWRAAEPGAFDPSRSEIDLCYREVFGGFRPRIALESGDGLLTVRAWADILVRDMLDDPAPVAPRYDVILVGDLFYERDTSARALAFLDRHAAVGTRVIVGDPGRT